MNRFVSLIIKDRHCRMSVPVAKDCFLNSTPESEGSNNIVVVDNKRQSRTGLE